MVSKVLKRGQNRRGQMQGGIITQELEGEEMGSTALTRPGRKKKKERKQPVYLSQGLIKMGGEDMKIEIWEFEMQKRKRNRKGNESYGIGKTTRRSPTESPLSQSKYSIKTPCCATLQ